MPFYTVEVVLEAMRSIGCEVPEHDIGWWSNEQRHEAMQWAEAFRRANGTWPTRPRHIAKEWGP